MEFADKFIPTAGVVGLLPMLTYFFMVVAMYAFLGNFLFAFGTYSSVAPEHRESRLQTAIIAAVAGISYFLIQDYYKAMLEELAQLPDALTRQLLIRKSYNAIGQFRYIDWAITTPILLLKTAGMLRVKFRNAAGPLLILLFADFFMVVTGYIGEQQLTPENDILVGPKLFWGGISTIGYLVIPIILFRFWRLYGPQALPEERRAFRLMGLATVTLWGVYPIGYMLTMLNVDMNYVHLSFTIADIINKVGVGLLSYQAAKQVLERRVPEEATLAGHTIG